MQHEAGPGAAEPHEAEAATAMGEVPETGEPPETREVPETEEAPETRELPETGELPEAGEPRVDAALGRLGELDELPLSEHPAVYEWIHEELVEVLGDLHPGQAPTDQLPADQAADSPPAGDDGSAGPSAGYAGGRGTREHES